MRPGITVCIATIPIREKMLRSALASVCVQTLKPAAIIVEYDHEHRGAVETKNRALMKVDTEWTAWLDDDDYFLPMHLETLGVQDRKLADVNYTWPQMMGNGDPRPDRFGQEFDAEELRRGSYIPTTSLFRTKMAQDVGGFQHPSYGEKYDDWGLWLAMLDAGATFTHIPARTWVWRVEGQNTSGKGDRW